MNKYKEHTRVNDIFLGPLERPALTWLAAHMPSWVTPDVCTIVGLLGAVLIAVSYGLSNISPAFLWLASLGFVINWLGDSLDGSLARYRRIERPKYGYFVDHVVDAVCQVLVFLGLGITPYINFIVACMALVSYLLLSVLVYLRTYVAGEFKISYGKLGPTESRVVAILLNTVMYFYGVQNFKVLNFELSPYDLPVAMIALLLLTFFINTSIKEVRRLAILGE